MAFWIELHCDTDPSRRGARASGEPEISLNPRCHSDRGDQLGEMGRVPGVGWACPHCLRWLADEAQRMELKT